jgi:exodeoxyribonuclease VII small subunit
MAKRPKNLTFGEAVAEVEKILADLEQDDVDIDRLSDEVKRAVELIQVCREKLEKTDGEVRELVAGLERTGKDEETADGSGEDLPF